jgi:hypothetical protein
VHRPIAGRRIGPIVAASLATGLVVALVLVALPLTPQRDRRAQRVVGRDRFKRTVRRRAGRIWGLLLVLALLLPLMIIAVLDAG